MQREREYARTCDIYTQRKQQQQLLDDDDDDDDLNRD